MSFGRVENQQQMLSIATATLVVLGLVARVSSILPTDVRQPVTTILGLAAICAALGFLCDPVARAQKPILLMDGSTVVRAADPRDNGKIVDTIDDEVMTAMGWVDHGRVDWAEATADIRAQQSSLFVITRPGEQRPIGVITAGIFDDPLMVKIGMWMGPGGRGQGHMRRALTLLTDRLAHGGCSFIAEIATTNMPARMSLEGAGFQQIGTKVHRLPNGVDTDALIFARYAESPSAEPPASTRQESE